jgi:hypothetical protein
VGLFGLVGLGLFSLTAHAHAMTLSVAVLKYMQDGEIQMARLNFFGAGIVALSLSGCVTTSMQGYADRAIPAHAAMHLAALVNAPLPLSEALQASFASQATKLGILVDDARSIFPPTRQYTDAEVKHDLAAQGIDAVLVVTVGDSGVVREYAGTVFSGTYSGTVASSAFGASYDGNSSGIASPTFRYHRPTDFNARLLEPSSGRSLWVGSGQVSAGGALFVGNGTSAASEASAIFNDMRTKGLIGAPQS